MGDHIGVFLCGSPVIGEELARQSLDPRDQLAAASCFLWFPLVSFSFDSRGKRVRCL